MTGERREVDDGMWSPRPGPAGRSPAVDLAAAAARASQRNGDGSLVAPGARPSPGTAPPLELLAGDIDRELGQAGPREGTILPIVWSSQHTVSPGTAGNGLIPIGNPQGLRNEQARRSRRCDCWCRAQPAQGGGTSEWPRGHQSSDQGDRHLTRLCGVPRTRPRVHPLLHHHIDRRGGADTGIRLVVEAR
jgi:hypothetical protein